MQIVCCIPDKLRTCVSDMAGEVVLDHLRKVDAIFVLRIVHIEPCSDHCLPPAVEEEEDEATKAQAPKAAIKVDVQREEDRHSGVIPCSQCCINKAAAVMEAVYC